MRKGPFTPSTITIKITMKITYMIASTPTTDNCLLNTRAPTLCF